MIKILVTGGNGQVGQELSELANSYSNFQFIFTNRAELDITKREAVLSFFEKHSLEYCINCAAYTAVDMAEEAQERAHTVNAIGALNIALACQQYQVRLIHLSTDYVYHSSTHNQPFKEEDKTSPKTVYGKTKLEGEQLAQRTCKETMIIRTSWVYSQFGHNFVKTMLRLGARLAKLTVIFDQIGSPTSATDLAEGILEIINKLQANPSLLQHFAQIYHYSNEGVCSWFDFAKAILTSEDINCDVLPVETKDYPTIAQRPAFSLLNKAKIKKNWTMEIPYWRDSLATCLEKLRKRAT